MKMAKPQHTGEDDLEKALANIHRASIMTLFHDLFDAKPTPSQTPPLKLHDANGSDFKRLLEKSRTKRYQQQWCTSKQPMYHQENFISSPHTQTTRPSLDSAHENWRCTQECAFRTDGSEETIFERIVDGVPIETLHHVLYPDGTVKHIQKQMTPSSSVSSALSSMSQDSNESAPNPVLKRAWKTIF
ncbi:hypothetical protein DM01DRAFT_1380863 [Hesseltinella vesiculosa]|uniref:Uncharacterized protein n=1 Tax=Hesseltinella vesiculosa TaxID=101127 RepID=A0A1X2GU68_9FUNG|nr:hypothetical protein DM01DRAFT_1380863 [Hesseltinella vesiculosa]